MFTYCSVSVVSDDLVLVKKYYRESFTDCCAAMLIKSLFYDSDCEFGGPKHREKDAF